MAEDPTPLRLVLDPAAPGALRELLRRGEEDLPSQLALARLAQRLQPQLSSPVSVPSSSAAKAWVFVGLTAVAAAVILALLAKRAPEAPPTAAPVAPTAPVAAPKLEPATSPLVESAPLPTSAPVATDPAPAQPSAHTKAAPARPSEVELLERARRALSTDPKRALALTQQHQSLYPRGILRQEREVIAIEALRRLGAPERASERAGSFEQRYPDSAHRRSVERGLQQ